MENVENNEKQKLLEVKELHIRYGNNFAVKGINFHIECGEIFGLLGPNGAGKTSTLSAIEGLIRPNAGSILVNGIDVLKMSSKAKASLGIQLQSTSFQPELTITEIIRLYSGLYGVKMKREDIAELLSSIQLQSESSKRYGQLSGGQQQRLSLAIATIHNPLLVLLDEPTSGLDPQSRRQLWDHIGKIRKSGRSILLTTHSMEEAQSVCDFISIIDHGDIIASGTPLELINQYKNHPDIMNISHGQVTLEDVFIGLTGKEVRN